MVRCLFEARAEIYLTDVYPKATLSVSRRFSHPAFRRWADSFPRLRR